MVIIHKVGVNAPSVDNILVSTTNTRNLNIATLAVTIDSPIVVSIVAIACVAAVITKFTENKIDNN